jgi:hypothetical protein
MGTMPPSPTPLLRYTATRLPTKIYNSSLNLHHVHFNRPLCVRTPVCWVPVLPSTLNPHTLAASSHTGAEAGILDQHAARAAVPTGQQCVGPAGWGGGV